MPSISFDPLLSAWKAMQSEPWMRLRYELAQAYLQRHMPPAPIQVLDVGGGNGTDSLPLAVAGHHVTILDPSELMLADARGAAEDLGIADRVTLVQGSIETLTTNLPGARFNVILCHNVLPYLAAPAEALIILRSYLEGAGMLSLINPNPAAEVLRIACQTYDLAQAAASIHSNQHHVAAFDTTVQHYPTEQIHLWMRAAGLVEITRYGIRCVCDFLADNTRKYDPTFYAGLLALELTMGAIEPYPQLARFHHVIARQI